MRQFLTWLFDMPLDLQRQPSSPMASLEHSISAAHHAHTAARRALAVAMAEETRESARRTALATKASDLEQRAVAALQAGREDLAAQAAEAIAAMATDINASERASTRFAAEVALARREVCSQRQQTVGSRSWPPACPDRPRVERHDANLS
jgi:phage shock protein A